MTLRLINSTEVRKLLPMKQCVELMRKAMILVAEGRAQQPLRSVVPHPNGQGRIGMMPGYIADPEWLGIKVTSVYPGNFGTELASHQGVVVLFNSKNGVPAAIMDAGKITAIRTAAASAVATDILARADAKTLAVFGYGEQAQEHLQAMTEVRNFERIVVWGRDLVKTEKFCSEQTAQLGVQVEPVASAKTAVTLSDVLCTTTAASEPFLRGEWLRAGQHLNIVGSSVPTTSEIDIDAVLRSRFYVDFLDSALALAGDFRRAREAGIVGDDHIIGSVGEVLIGRKLGRTSARDITLFKSLGMVAEDLVSADFILGEADRKGIGVTVNW